MALRHHQPAPPHRRRQELHPHRRRGSRVRHSHVARSHQRRTAPAPCDRARVISRVPACLPAGNWAYFRNTGGKESSYRRVVPAATAGQFSSIVSPSPPGSPAESSRIAESSRALARSTLRAAKELRDPGGELSAIMDTDGRPAGMASTDHHVNQFAGLYPRAMLAGSWRGARRSARGIPQVDLIVILPQEHSAHKCPRNHSQPRPLMNRMASLSVSR